VDGILGPNLAEIQRRLLQTVRERARNGEITERGVARSAGISQPHIHNVLNGSRTLSLEFTDLILKCMDLTALDLCTPPELEEYLKIRRAALRPALNLPFVSNAIGPGRPWRAGLDREERYSIRGEPVTPGQELVVARLLPDINMQYSKLGHDIAVLDISEIDSYSSDTLYVVDRGRDTVLRGIRLGLDKVYLVADAEADYPARWEAISSPQGSAAVVRARVCRFGRETKSGRAADR
jgi:hypothetical protein